MTDHPHKLLDRDSMIAWFTDGEKPADQWGIGTEHEKLLFNCQNRTRPGYDDEHGIRYILDSVAKRDGWQGVMENGNIIATKHNDGSSITLEPGGQLELSGAVLKTLHQTCAETHSHLDLMTEIMAADCIWMLGIGFDPKWRRQDIPWMPKGRYQIMRDYMPKVGTKGLDMMLRTCTIQVNLDFSSEADMVKKFRTSLALQPVATAIFANSPFIEGKPSGYLSSRAAAWVDTDPDRSGVPDCVFDNGFGYEQWVDYLLDVPMYFLHRGDDYKDVAGLSFHDFMAGQLPGYEGEYPDINDWEDHTTTAFPEVRLKQFIEMRGADGGDWSMICALPALWVGLLYDDQALDEAADLAKHISAGDVLAGRISAAKDGLKGQMAGDDLSSLAKRMVAIADQGLKRRNLKNDVGDNEAVFLNVVKSIVDKNETQAEHLLTCYHEKWGQNVDHLYDEYRLKIESE